MPASLYARGFVDHRYPSVTQGCSLPLTQLLEPSSRCVTIGLINNMPEAAFRATERQFVSLLDSASEDIPVRLSLFVLPGIPTKASSDSCYSSAEALWDMHLDGLIVTGREPMMPDLRDEPYWESFTQVLEWARENTCSTLWSCLAAHAAILHMDGIDRYRSDDKQFGIFACAGISSHWLTAGVPPRFQVPHSRWHGVAEKDLVAHGYQVLTRNENAEIDIFIKQDKSLFVFFQGHPEYEPHTQLREYRRDVARYLRYEANTYPSVPRGYFDQSTEDTLMGLRENALACRNRELLARNAAALEKVEIAYTWRITATLIYRNWLKYLWAAKKTSQLDGQLTIASV